ncbi:MAG: glycosyltransferase family 4 protein [Alphaproteobacteria bacterium]|nr:glycosyltransferase family 4 protein [Alphaproteobacteria bacterium]
MTADTVGGVWTFAIELSAALAGYGVELTLLSMGRLPDEAQQAEADALPNLRLVPTAFRLEWMQNCQSDVVESGQVLTQLAREVQPDVIHLNGYYHATLPFDVPLLLTAHSCVASWLRASKRQPIPLEWQHYMRWISGAVPAAGMITAPTRTFLTEFESLHGRGRAARAIWNGRSPLLFRTGPKRNVVLAAGRLWDEAKNISILRQVVPHLDVPVLIAGEDISPDAKQIDVSGLGMLGRLSRTALASAMAEARIFASPARYEPFGLAILEAALSGCALALGDLPTLRELWDGAALFVPPDDVEGWQRTLALLTKDRALTAALGHRAHERARQYTPERMAAEYVNAYSTLLSAPSTMGVAA